MVENSTASSSDIERYSWGECHVFAVALHRRFGWPMKIVTDLAERYWEDPDDPDNYIPSVVHVYAVDENDMAWDISGVRPVSEIYHDLNTWCKVKEYDSEMVHSEAGLRYFVGCWSDDPDTDEIDRPLMIYDDDDVLMAEQVAESSLKELLEKHDHIPKYSI